MTAWLDRPPIVRLRGGSRNSPKLKSHQWLSATHPHDQNTRLDLHTFRISRSRYMAKQSQKKSQSQTSPSTNHEPGKISSLVAKTLSSASFQTQFSARTSVTRPLCTRRIAAYRVRSHPRTCSFPRSPPRRPRCSPPSRPATPRRPPTFAEEVPTIISEGMFSASRTAPSRSPGPSAARAGSA